MKTKISHISQLFLFTFLLSCSGTPQEVSEKESNKETTSLNTKEVSDFESYFLPTLISDTNLGQVALLNLDSNPKTERYQKTELHIDGSTYWFNIKTFGENISFKEERQLKYLPDSGWLATKEMVVIREMKEAELIKRNAFPRSESDTSLMIYEVKPNDSLTTRVAYKRWFKAFETISVLDKQYEAMKVGETRITEAFNSNGTTPFKDSISLDMWFVKGLGLVELNFDGIPTPLKIQKIFTPLEWNKISPDGMEYPIISEKQEEID